jgi:hypothetical protein
MSRSVQDPLVYDTPVYVVYPAALFDGWEVVKEHDDAPVFFQTREDATAYAETRAALDGVAFVKVENWFGDTESVREVRVPDRRRRPHSTARRDATRGPVSCADDARRTRAGQPTSEQ